MKEYPPSCGSVLRLWRESRRGAVRVGHAYGYAFDLPRGRGRALRGVEEGELAEPAARPHQGVTFRVVHDVEPEVRGQEPGGRIPDRPYRVLCDPISLPSWILLHTLFSSEKIACGA